MQHVTSFITPTFRPGPDRVLGNLFPAREIYFPGINIPSWN